MTWRTGALMALALAGCSLVYNPNNLPNPGDTGDAGRPGDASEVVDAAADAPVIVDATPSLLEILDIAPTELDEGQGEGGSLPGLFVIRGRNLVSSNLKIELTP